AFDLTLPVIIHNREASADVLTILAESSLQEVEKPGVLHSFLGEPETAKKALEMGYFLGFTGPITYKKNEWLRDILRETPTDRILVETDGPFLSPQKHRGQRNEPAYVKEIAKFMARILKIDEAIFANITTENAACLFGREEIYGESGS
ncbi:MAG: TatD family hydrolase, partial [Chloroflexota bacterium]